MMGTGEATGERRAIEAAESAIANPLLDDVSLKGAKGVLINITGGADLTLYEVDEAASLIRGQVDPEANIIIGSALDKDLDGIVRISVVATGVESGQKFAPITKKRKVEAAIAEIPSIEEDETEIKLDTSTIMEDEVAEPELEQETLSKQAKPAPFTYTRPGAEAAQADDILKPLGALERVVPDETPSVVKPIFGFFGRKKTKPALSITQPEPALNHTGDLFGTDEDDELEIPSFLRRGK